MVRLPSHADRPLFPSLKTCHHCGHVKQDLTLSDREWQCPKCPEMLDRDLNAAINIKKRGQEILDENTVGVAGMNACGDDKVAAFGRQWSSMKQEAQRL